MTGGLSLRVMAPLREFALDLELEVAPGERLAVVGPSGAGKTSTLRLVAGLLTPRTGRVALDDEVWLDTEAAIDLPPERRRCGYVFQDYALFSRMSVWRNVAHGMREDTSIRAPRPRRGDARPLRDCEPHRRPSRRALGRRAATHRPCPRPGGGTAGAASRRAAVGTGRGDQEVLGAGAPRPAGRHRHPDPPGHAFLRRGCSARRHDRRPRPRVDRAKGLGRGDLGQAPVGLHRGRLPGGDHARARPQAHRRRPSGRAPRW